MIRGLPSKGGRYDRGYVRVPRIRLVSASRSLEFRTAELVVSFGRTSGFAMAELLCSGCPKFGVLVAVLLV